MLRASSVRLRLLNALGYGIDMDAWVDLFADMTVKEFAELHRSAIVDRMERWHDRAIQMQEGQSED